MDNTEYPERTLLTIKKRLILAASAIDLEMQMGLFFAQNSKGAAGFPVALFVFLTIAGLGCQDWGQNN